MSNTAKLIVSVFSICILAIGTIFLWTQNAKGNDVEKPSISQQSETDGKISQNEQLRVETPKKRPFLTKKHTHQPVIPKKQVQPRRVNDKISLPVQLSTDINDLISPQPRPLTMLSPLQLILNTQVILDPIQLDIAILGIMDEYKKGKLDLEYVVNFFESQHHYEPAILEELEPRRAFKYFDRIVRVSRDTVKAYAERILAKDPDNPDAQAHMVRYEKDNTKAAALYRKILIKHPDHPPTLSGLGYRLLDHSPDEALQYLKKANLLDPTLGLMGLGREYERLGDVKTAWFCYKKSITIRNRENRKKEKFPPSRICITYAYVDKSNLYAIEGGKYWKSAIKLVPDSNGNTIRKVLTFQSVNAQQEREIREFYQFRDWVENILSKKLVNRRNDFLIKEVEKHLEGGKPMFDPERIVRAYEITTRYPGKDGIQRLKKTDFEFALEIERLLQEQLKD